MANKKRRVFLLLLSISALSSFILILGLNSVKQVKAEGEAEAIDNNKYYSIHLDEPTIAKGYTVTGFDDALKLSLVPGILSSSTRVDIIELHETLDMPWSLNRISEVYQFEFRNKAAYDKHKPFYIQFAYNEKTNNHKQVFFFDKNFGTWRPLPTRDFPRELFVRSLIHLPFARIAVFEYEDILTVGRASWYSYKSGNFAASPDFLKGSRLRVRSPHTDKFVDVEINDYGPDRRVFPDRVVDLDKVAFMALNTLGAGTIDVEIEPLYIAPDNGSVLGISAEGVGILPATNFKSFIIYDEQSSETLWGKDATTTLPLASLTKLVAIKVFLDTRPSLNREVAYSIKDEEYNYEYCKPWESAKLNLSDGETLTIEDLVYASLVGSANNTIETLVRVSGLSRDDFISLMNSEVVKWGASNTHFVEPTGLAPENVSSAADYAIITKEVFTHPIIEKASVAEEYEFYTINTEKRHRIKNTNHLIRTDKYNITGSKTGYLDEAGYCLMTRVAIPGGNLIVISMGAADRTTSFLDTEKLIKYGLNLVE